jgi:hypothetical protein
MPRVIGAVLMAGLGWFVSDMVRPLMPESTVFGWFNHVNAALGIIVGWSLLGPKAGGGLMVALSNGVTAAFGLATLGVFVQAANEVLRLSTRLRYSDPLRAFEDIFRVLAEFGAVLLHATVIGPLIIGAVVIAIVVEITNSWWR